MRNLLWKMGRAVSKVTLTQQFAATAKADGIIFANLYSRVPKLDRVKGGTENALDDLHSLVGVVVNRNG